MTSLLAAASCPEFGGVKVKKNTPFTLAVTDAAAVTARRLPARRRRYLHYMSQARRRAALHLAASSLQEGLSARSLHTALSHSFPIIRDTTERLLSGSLDVNVV